MSTMHPSPKHNSGEVGRIRRELDRENQRMQDSHKTLRDVARHNGHNNVPDPHYQADARRRELAAQKAADASRARVAKLTKEMADAARRERQGH